MKSILSTEIPKNKLIKRISDIRVCDICRSGYWYGELCPNYENEMRIRTARLKKKEEERRKEQNRIKELSYKERRKLLKIKKVKKNECKTCGELSGKNRYCSKVCNLRFSSAWFDADGIHFIEIEKAQKILDTRLERKRLKDA